MTALDTTKANALKPGLYNCPHRRSGSRAAAVATFGDSAVACCRSCYVSLLKGIAKDIDNSESLATEVLKKAT